MNVNVNEREKYVALSNYRIYYTKKNRKAPTWNEKLGLPDESYFVSDIQDYFEYMMKKYKTKKT